MARYEHLPIYKQSYDLLLEMHKLVPNFPKKYKYTLGGDIIKCLTESIITIMQINSREDKIELFEKLILNFEKIKLEVRILKSLEVFSKKTYFFLSEKNIEILKQCEGWKKRCLK